MIYPDFDPVLLEIGPLKVRWYGLMYLAGFLSFWWLGRLRARRAYSPIGPEQVDDLLFYGALGVVLGGRIGYTLFYNLDQWLTDPLQLFRIWEGGMSFHGGLLGVVLAVWLFARKVDCTLFRIADFVAPLVPLGLLAGRIGNFINGELWGAPADVPWAMQVSCLGNPSLCADKLHLPPGTLLTPPLHPSMLYEGLLEGLLLFLVLWWYSAKPRALMSVSGLFLIGYGASRLLVEFVRMPDAHLGYLAYGWVTMGQLLSLPMILLGVVLMVLSQRNRMRA